MVKTGVADEGSLKVATLPIGRAREGPGEGQRVAVDVRRRGAVERHRGAEDRRRVGAGTRHRRRVHGGHRDQVWSALQSARIGDDQLKGEVAWHVNDEGGRTPRRDSTALPACPRDRTAVTRRR